MGVALKLSFVGANSHPRIEPFDRLDTKVSYFSGSDPEGWRPDVPVWGGVRYLDLYPGVDLELSSVEGYWQWRIVVEEGASLGILEQVRLRIEGAEEVRPENALNGRPRRLHLRTLLGQLTLPLLEIRSVEHLPLDALPEPQLHGLEVSFPLCPPLGRSAALKSDWLGDLLHGAYLGGGDDDVSYGIAVDDSGSAYVTGYTRSSEFRTTPGALDPSYSGGSDVFVAKLDPGGTALAYATFLGGGGEGWAIKVDGSGAAYVTGYTESADFRTTPGAFDRTHYGGLDVLVSNAGIYPRMTLPDLTEEVWDTILDVNLLGHFFCVKHAIPHMIARGGGSIMFIGSVHGYKGDADVLAYSAAKGGLWIMTRNLARTYAPRQIRVNWINPGWVASEGEVAHRRELGYPDGWLEEGGRKLPMGRLQTPEDAAHLCVFLASDEATQLTATQFNVDGGLSVVM